jgi:hypothetical protein
MAFTIDQDLIAAKAKKALTVSANQHLVLWVGGKALPVLFWLSIIGSFFVAYRAASFAGLFGGGGFSFLTFIEVLIVSLIGVLLFFYVLYLLKAIKDTISGEESCNCGDTHKEGENTPGEDAEKPHKSAQA